MLADKITQLRKKNGWSQEELAEKLYVSRQTVSRWETDSTFPDVEAVIKLCEIFGCNMDTLVRGDAQSGSTCECSGVAKPAKNEEIEQLKEEIKRKRRLNERLMGVIAGPLALLSMLVYFLCGFLGNLWHPAWLIFVGFGVVCGVSAIVIDAVLGISSDTKKLRAEKRKLKTDEIKKSLK